MSAEMFICKQCGETFESRPEASVCTVCRRSLVEPVEERRRKPDRAWKVEVVPAKRQLLTERQQVVILGLAGIISLAIWRSVSGSDIPAGKVVLIISVGTVLALLIVGAFYRPDIATVFAGLALMAGGWYWDKQPVVIIGGFIFLAGVIWLAVRGTVFSKR